MNLDITFDFRSEPDSTRFFVVNGAPGAPGVGAPFPAGVAATLGLRGVSHPIWLSSPMFDVHPVSTAIHRPANYIIGESNVLTN